MIASHVPKAKPSNSKAIPALDLAHAEPGATRRSGRVVG
jgi:hypothetical protein